MSKMHACWSVPQCSEGGVTVTVAETLDTESNRWLRQIYGLDTRHSTALTPLLMPVAGGLAAAAREEIDGRAGGCVVPTDTARDTAAEHLRKCSHGALTEFARRFPNATIANSNVRCCHVQC